MIDISQKTAQLGSVLDGNEGGIERPVGTHTGGSNLTLTTLLEMAESAYSF